MGMFNNSENLYRGLYVRMKHNDRDDKLQNTLSPKGYRFYSNIDWDSAKDRTHVVSFYKAIRKAAKDCRRPIGMVIRQSSYQGSTLVYEPSVYIAVSDSLRFGKLNELIDRKIDEARIDRGYDYYMTLPLDVIVSTVREAVFEAVKLGIF